MERERAASAPFYCSKTVEEPAMAASMPFDCSKTLMERVRAAAEVAFQPMSSMAMGWHLLGKMLSDLCVTAVAFRPKGWSLPVMKLFDLQVMEVVSLTLRPMSSMAMDWHLLGVMLFDLRHFADYQMQKT